MRSSMHCAFISYWVKAGIMLTRGPFRRSMSWGRIQLSAAGTITKLAGGSEEKKHPGVVET